MEASIRQNDLATVHDIIESGFKYRRDKPTNFRRIEGHEGGCQCQHHMVQAGPYPVLLDCIGHGMLEMVTLVLKADPDLDCMNPYGYGPLQLAAQIRNRDTRWSMVKMLMDAGATVVDDGFPKFATTCVHQAVTVNDFELVKFFLGAGASLNCLDLSDRSLFHSAYLYIPEGVSRFNMVKQLVEAGADVNIAGKKRCTFLHFIVGDVECEWDMVKLLLDHGAHLNILDVDNVSPLARAAGGDNIELVKSMIEAGANINISKHFTGSPLQFAVSSCNKDMVQLLLKHGADIKVQDQDGKNILTCAAEIDGPLHKRSIEKLVFEGQNDFYVKKKAEYKDILELILAQGVTMNTNELGENMPFMSVLKSGNLDAMNLLMEKGVTLETCGVRFPLHLAAYNHNHHVMQFLLEKRLYDVNKLNDDGVTPLYIATRHRYAAAVVNLIENGADVNVVCEEIVSRVPLKIVKRTALSEAMISGSLREFHKPNSYHVDDVLSLLGDFRLVEFLICVGANVSSPDVRRTCNILAGAVKAFTNFGIQVSEYPIIIIKCFVKYLLLVRVQNDPVLLRLQDHISKQIPEISEFMEKCSDEIEHLKSVIMYGSTTLYDMLRRKDITSFISNQHVIKKFGSLDFEDKFKIYGFGLYNCFTMAQHKRKLMDDAKGVLNELLGFRFDNFEGILHNIMVQLPIKDIITLCHMHVE